MGGLMESVKSAITGNKGGIDKVLSITPTGERVRERFQLPDSQTVILDTLTEKGPCTPRDLESETSMSRQRVHEAVTSLVAKGYIKWQTDATQ